MGIKSVIIRNANEKFLDEQEGNYGAVSQMKWTIIYNLSLFHLQLPILIYRPVQAGSGPILRFIIR